MPNTPLYSIGDLHGHYTTARRLLFDAGLIDPSGAWAGGDAALWFTGDLFDRGPDGIATLELVMRLQREASLSGGKVGALLGNHELMILSARRFGAKRCSLPGKTFLNDWLINGGSRDDLDRLEPAHVEWIQALPALAHVGDALLVHADSWLYAGYGGSVDEVNRTFHNIAVGDDRLAWERVLDQFADRDGFLDRQGDPGARAREFLALYGGQRIIHGHSPISRLAGRAPQAVTSAHVYAAGLCVNVDGGIYLGGPGFVYREPFEESP
jgi:hypothetical protein